MNAQTLLRIPFHTILSLFAPLSVSLGCAEEERDVSQSLGDVIPCDPETELGIDFSLVAHHTLVDEQYAALGVHFNGVFYAGRRTIDYPEYTKAPLPLNFICTFVGAADTGRCVSPLGPNGGVGATFDIDLDFPVTSARIQARTRADGALDRDAMFLTAFDAANLQIGPTVTVFGSNEPAPYLPEGVLNGQISDPEGRIRRIVVKPGDTDALGPLCLTKTKVNHPPVALCMDQTLPADATCSGSASVDAGSFDPDPGDTITCTQSPPGPYSDGTTGVTLTCVDNHGASDSCTARVTVSDITPPDIQCPAAQEAECLNGGAVVTFDASATDNCSLESLTCSPLSGSVFPLGTTPDTCTATDRAGNQASCTFDVVVQDTLPPVIVPAPPIEFEGSLNHDYQIISLADCVDSFVDQCTGPGNILESGKIVRVTSDEPEAEGGAGNTCNDIVILNDTSVQVRRERRGTGDGRVYTIFFTADDGHGNVVQSSCKVDVCHSSGHCPAVDSGCAYCVGSGCGACPGHDPSCDH